MDAQYRRINSDDVGVEGYNDDDNGENGHVGESEDARRERRTSRDLEDGFRDDSDDEEEEEEEGGQRDGRRRGEGENGDGSEYNGLREMVPRPLEDERRFPAVRI